MFIQSQSECTSFDAQNRGSIVANQYWSRRDSAKQSTSLNIGDDRLNIGVELKLTWNGGGAIVVWYWSLDESALESTWEHGKVKVSP